MTRLTNWLNLTVFLASVAAIAVAVNVFAQRADLRGRIDATKTRAYSLSHQTMRMVRSLDGEWTIAMLVVEDGADRAMRRQIDEVLARFTQASSNITVKRIDPTNPRTIAEYESLLTRLRAIYADLSSRYETNLDAGTSAIGELDLFAQEQSGMLDQLVQIAGSSAGERAASLAQPVQIAQALALLSEQARLVIDEVAKHRQISDSRPIPDYESARSILAHALKTAANELYEVSEILTRWTQQQDLPGDVRRWASSERRTFERRAAQFAAAAEPLAHLEPLELSRIGLQLARGEAALIIGPKRAAVIPSDQLIARSNIRQAGTGGSVTFDQRFRGEQLIAAAMRSLLVDHMPMVVFVHAEERSMFRPRENQLDLVGVGNVLSASRFDVAEWIVGDSDRPVAQPGQPMAFVVVPPPQRPGLEPPPRERQLLRAVEQLIAEGEPVLLSVYPSLLPRYGQPDPWARLAAPMGMTVDTNAAVHESARIAADRVETIKGQALQQYERGHPIASAVHGQQAYFTLPTPIRLREGTGVRHDVVASIAPSAARWLEPDWREPADRLNPPPPDSEKRFTESVSVVVAAERPNPVKRGEQRMVLVSSGGWMMSNVADLAVSIGGDRLALVNPAHHELMLASAAWLTGMDDLIAQSPTSQEVARLGEISKRAGVFWAFFLVIVLPIGCLILGLGVWLVRTSSYMPSSKASITIEDAPGATTGLVLGILSILLSAPIIGLILGVVGFQHSRHAKSMVVLDPGTYTNAGIAQAGYVCSIVGIALGSITTFAGLAYVIVALS